MDTKYTFPYKFILDAIIRPAQVTPISIWKGPNDSNATCRDWAVDMHTTENI